MLKDLPLPALHGMSWMRRTWTQGSQLLLRHCIYTPHWVSPSHSLRQSNNNTGSQEAALLPPTLNERGVRDPPALRDVQGAAMQVVHLWTRGKKGELKKGCFCLLERVGQKNPTGKWLMAHVSLYKSTDGKSRLYDALTVAVHCPFPEWGRKDSLQKAPLMDHVIITSSPDHWRTLTFSGHIPSASYTSALLFTWLGPLLYKGGIIFLPNKAEKKRESYPFWPLLYSRNDVCLWPKGHILQN